MYRIPPCGCATIHAARNIAASTAGHQATTGSCRAPRVCALLPAPFPPADEPQPAYVRFFFSGMPAYDRCRPGKQGRADLSGALCAGVPDAKQTDVAKLAPEVLRHDLRRDVLQVDAVVALDGPRYFLGELGEKDDAAARLP